MIKESIKDLVLAIADGNTLAIEDSFNSVMASKISDRLDSMRVDVAQGMFGSVDESYDSSDAYETWDPKHPKFKDKLIKHHAKGGTTQSFIDQEKAKAKKKLTREEVELDEASEIWHQEIGDNHYRVLVNGKTHSNYKGSDAKLKAQAQVKKLKGIKESFDIEDYSVEELEDFMMSEDFEQLDEISKKTLGSYVKKASGKLASHGINMVGSLEKSDIANAEYHGTKIEKRQKGISKATDKLTKESFEELDEISKATLGSYVKKATTNAIISGEALGKGEKWSKSGQIASKREKGIRKAIDKLTKEEFTLEDYSLEELEDFMMSEEFEQLDELSKKTLGSYVKKATSDVGLAGFVKGTTVNDHSRSKDYDDAATMNKKRKVGIAKAVDKLTKD